MRRGLSPGLVALLLLSFADAAEPPSSRGDAIKAVCNRLGIREGMTVADIGCGKGADSFVFADVVGPTGTVLAEEINEGLVKDALSGARERKLRQVVPILGETDDPHLPDGSANLIYMHYVFHHFANPVSMLQNMWRDLRPGGYMVIVERGKGPLRDWAPLAEREKSHHLTGETAVVRQAREAGFLFADFLDDLWVTKEDFVAVFQRPEGSVAPSGDPDLPASLEAAKLIPMLPAPRDRPLNVLVVALDRGRAVLSVLRDAPGGTWRIFDLVLEEWATTLDETPPVPDGLKVEVLRTKNGTLELPGGCRLDAVLFVDAYHRLWEPEKILRAVHERMAPDGTLLIVDRDAPDGEPRRLSNHRRRISPLAVRKDLEQAGFEVLAEPSPPARDRFALLFKARAAERWVSPGRADPAAASLAPSQNEQFDFLQVSAFAGRHSPGPGDGMGLSDEPKM